jgi:hypothetical protein
MVDVRWAIGSAAPTGVGRAFTILAGYVSLNATPPAAFDDPVWVIVPSHSPDAPYGPLDWPAEHGNTLPAAGTPVVIGIDDVGAAHVLRWSGQHS